MPPVEVPAIKSNDSAILLFVRFSIFVRMVAGIIHLIPPPSIERILFILVSFQKKAKIFVHKY